MKLKAIRVKKPAYFYCFLSKTWWLKDAQEKLCKKKEKNYMCITIMSITH